MKRTSKKKKVSEIVEEIDNSKVSIVDNDKIKKGVAIVTAIWKRHELTGIILNYYNELKKEIPNLVLIAVGSEGDVSRKLAEDNGWNYVEASNAPLSQKWNKVFGEVVKYNVIGAIGIGSDDLLSKKVIQYILDKHNEDTLELIGFDRCWFYNVASKQLVCGDYNNIIDERFRNMTIGAGRFYSTKILRDLKYMPWGTEKVNRGLDATGSRILVNHGIKEKQIALDFGLIVDVKTRQNLNKFDIVKNPVVCDVSILDKNFKTEIDKINALPIEIEPEVIIEPSFKKPVNGEVRKYEVVRSTVWEMGKVLTLETSTAIAIAAKHKLKLIS